MRKKGLLHVLFIQYVTPDDVFPLRMLPFSFIYNSPIHGENEKSLAWGDPVPSDVIPSIIPTRRRKSISQKPGGKK